MYAVAAMNPFDVNRPGSMLALWGYGLAVVGVVIALVVLIAAPDGAPLIDTGRDAALVGGPLLIAGAVLIAAGEIVGAVRDR